MCGQIKKNLFFAFLLSSFVFVNAFAVETADADNYEPKSYEYEARDKRFGIEDKSRDSIDVQQKNC